MQLQSKLDSIVDPCMCKDLVVRLQIYMLAQTEEIGATFLGAGVAWESDYVCSSHSVWLMV